LEIEASTTSDILIENVETPTENTEQEAASTTEPIEEPIPETEG